MEDSLTTHEEFKRLRAENARLQTKVEEAKVELAEHGCHKVEKGAFRERDGYAAQSKVRGEALEGAAAALCDGCEQGWPVVVDGTLHHEPGPDRYVHCRAQEQRAAIDITPEEAREKERA